MTVRHYQVEWSENAVRDLEGLCDFVSQESVEAAIKILEKIKQAAGTLAIFPRRGRIIPELKEQGILLYHELVIAPWRLFYRITERQVYVLALLDSRRNIEDVLLERLTRSGD